jgi:PKD repeat protein
MVSAPDGKIYISHLDRSYLSVINNPNSSGVACNYVSSAYNLANGAMTSWGGLPNFFEDYINPKLLKSNFSYSQSIVGDTIYFTNNSIAANNFIWYFGDGTTSILQNPFHVYASSGYYSVSLFAKDSSCDVDRLCQTIYVSSTTGVTELTNDFHFIIAPNPFNDKLILKTEDNEKTELFFYDILSLEILHVSFIHSVTINTELFANGIYIFELRNSKGVRKKGKVIKQ